MRHEVGLSGGLHGAGFRSGSYFQETDADRRLARRRVRWWAAHRPGITRSPRGSREAAPAGARAVEPFRRARDRALDRGRLPYVKLDTLRFDPYGLGADKLLTYCEQQLPEAFAGVREFLQETAVFYPPRPTEALRPRHPRGPAAPPGGVPPCPLTPPPAPPGGPGVGTARP